MSARRGGGSRLARRVGLLALALACGGMLAAPSVLAQSRSGFEYNGIVQVSWWFDEYDGAQGGPSRAALRDTGANWMGLLVTWYQDNAQSNVIARHPDPNKDHSDARIRAAIRDAQGRGLQVMLKPHVDALNGQWRGDFNPTNADAWFQSYTQFILHYAQIAQEEGVDGFVMGTELRTISGAANRARWISVINAIRSVYGGVLTYAANATYPADEFTSVSFWDQLDLIGLDGYFNLTNLDNPTVPQLIAAWTNNRNGENSVAAVQNFASGQGKPLIFTEIGYKSTNRTNVEPWNFGLGGAVDTQEQRDCYEAAFTVWSQQSAWMKGVFWWAWTVPPPPANDGDYNPRGKPAEQVLRTWQGPGGASFTLSASPASLTVSQGAGGTSAIAITRSGGFTGAVDLSASGLPAGVTATFSPDPTTGNTSTLTLTASSTAAAGTVNVTINGTGGGLTRSTTLSLTVTAPNFGLSVSPTSLALNAGGSGTATITVIRSGGFAAQVCLTVTGVPSGASASLNHPCTPPDTFTLTVGAGTATGSFTVTVTGTGGGLTRTTSLSVTVNSMSNFVLSASPASLTVSRGASGTSTIGISRTSFTGSVDLGASGLPAGVTAAFSPDPTTGNSSLMTLSASSTAAAGTVSVTINGTGSVGTRATTLSLTVPGPNVTLSASPASLTINQGGSGTSTIAISRAGGFTASMAFAASGLPSGVTATFSPASTTGTSTLLTLSASSTATTGMATVTVTGNGGGLTRTTPISLAVNAGGGGGNGGVTVTPTVGGSPPWYHEMKIGLSNTAALTALSLTVVVQRTPGINNSGAYNTVGGSVIQQDPPVVTPTTVTYVWRLQAGQSLGAGAGRLFVGQMSGSGTPHPTSGDTYTVTYTTGGQGFTRSGSFP